MMAVRVLHVFEDCEAKGSLQGDISLAEQISQIGDQCLSASGVLGNGLADKTKVYYKTVFYIH